MPFNFMDLRGNVRKEMIREVIDMKKSLIIFFMGFMLAAFLGCNTEGALNVAEEPNIMELAEYNNSNFKILLDYDKKMEDNLKIFVDGRLCKDGKMSGYVAHELITYPLSLDEGFHDVTVVIDNKKRSTMRFKVSDELQWLSVSYEDSEVFFVAGKGMILID